MDDIWVYVPVVRGSSEMLDCAGAMDPGLWRNAKAWGSVRQPAIFSRIPGEESTFWQ